jgi:Ser/Thr protein kinase RdoA (MazF antagonist)
MAAEIDPALTAWALETLAPGGSLVDARGLRDGGAPWLLQVREADGSEAWAVLRVGPSDAPGDIRTEAAALRFAGANGLAVPMVLGMRDDADPPLLLIERVRGSSDIPATRAASRLRTLGAFAARMAALVPPAGFERRTRAISGVDFGMLRRDAARRPLLQRAESVVGSYLPESPDCLVHGDMWQGNSMWIGDQLQSIIELGLCRYWPGGHRPRVAAPRRGNDFRD